MIDTTLLQSCNKRHRHEHYSWAQYQAPLAFSFRLLPGIQANFKFSIHNEYSLLLFKTRAQRKKLRESENGTYFLTHTFH